MRDAFIAFLLCVAVLAGTEVFLHDALFNKVSYSNSESIDHQLRERNAADDWDILFIGNSETRWGIDPAMIDAAFLRHGIVEKSFNHAFDGFGPSWWPLLLPPILKHPSLRNVRVVVLGVQMINEEHVIRPLEQERSELQRPVLMSPFAIDLGVEELFRKESWDATLSRKLFSGLWAVRYSSAVRTLLFPTALYGTEQVKFRPRRQGESYHGFEPHMSIDLDQYPLQLANWKAQFNEKQDFKPLPPDIWKAMTGNSGFFDELCRIVRSSGKELVLFALPTNPVIIDTFRRRENYHRNADLLRRWAAERNVLFVDFGIQDVQNPTEFFSDVRHLSAAGARSFSWRLGESLAASELVAPLLAGGRKKQK
jgi:hypothetical protein